MNIARKTFGMMTAGYRKKKLRKYYDSLADQPMKTQVKTNAGETIPITIQPIVRPIEYPFPNQPRQRPIQIIQQAPQAQPIQQSQPVQQIQQIQQPQIQQTQPQVPAQTQPQQTQKPQTKFKGYHIPDMGSKTEMSTVTIEGGSVKPIIYPLIPENPKKGEAVLAYAKIHWEQKYGRYIYEVIEPEMTENIKSVLDKIKELLEERLDVDFSKLKISEATDYLRSEIDKLISYYKFNINSKERKILQYFIERDFMGLGKIEPMMHDSQIEDISCDGIGIPLFIFHRNPQLGSIITNTVFDDGDQLDSFITKLSQLSGKSISVAEPLLDGALPDGSRLQATLATDIARKGSNFTIRKFSSEPMTPIHLLNYGTLNVQSLAYLWMAIEYGRNILVSGGTASGKTSFLNALSIFIRPDKKIISIEDTAELRLPHPHWIPTIARTSVGGNESDSGHKEIDMFALLKESLRQRPDYIIVGEVRGQEAFVLFQQMATGHPSYATIHAENMDKLVNRLTSAPISLSKSLVGSLDVVVFTMRAKYRDKFVRRTSEIVEMINFDNDKSKPDTNTVFKWDAQKDLLENVNDSTLLKKLTDVTGMPEKEIVEELKRRMAVLEWVHQRNITDYEEVYKIINMYYNYPNRLLGAIYGAI